MKSLGVFYDRLIKEPKMDGMTRVTFSAGRYEDELERTLVELDEKRVVLRIWEHDHTVWKPDPKEIENRLGWLHIASKMKDELKGIDNFVEEVKSAGYTRAVLLGMGGSSLAPDCFRRVFGVGEGFLDLKVLDSTDPGAVSDLAESLDPGKTLFIVATKSGTTIETLSFFKFFYNLVEERLGGGKAGEHFIAITDPKSSLTEKAERLRFRGVFENDPNIGGRYSALSYFGLVPAALMGVDIGMMLERALVVASDSEAAFTAADGKNAAARLGAFLGALHNTSINKATFLISPKIAPLGDWLEQLIAESTGKEGVGILPVVDEPPGKPSLYGDDRVFVHIRLDDEMSNDHAHDRFVTGVEEAGHPVVRLAVTDPYDLGGQFFMWEMAVAVIGHLLKINPFDQPDVESAKVLAKEAAARYRETGVLPEEVPILTAGEISIYGDAEAKDPGKALVSFLESRRQGNYVALMAYLEPGEGTTEKMSRLREKILGRFSLATTFGYGPRFLHSTGQLHKGDSGGGLFVQFTADDDRDIPIPDEAGEPGSSITFGVLKAAQAMGDRQALLNAGRKVIRFHLGSDIEGGLELLLKTL